MRQNRTEEKKRKEGADGEEEVTYCIEEKMYNAVVALSEVSRIRVKTKIGPNLIRVNIIIDFDSIFS